MTTDRPPRSLKKKLAFAAVPWLLLLAAEGAVRVRERVLYGSFVRAGTNFYSPGKTAPLPNKGVDVAGSRMQVHINALGFRGPEIAVPKPAGTFRVVCLGGSTTFDVLATSDEAAWPGRLEKILRAKHPRVEVVNAGLGGYATDHSLMPEYWSNVEKVEPDVVVVYHATNDIAQSAQRLNVAHVSSAAAPTPPSLATRALKGLTDWSLLAYKVWLAIDTLLPPPEKEGKGTSLPQGEIDRFERNMREIVRRSKAKGAKVALATFALRWRADQPLETQRKLAEGAFNIYPGLSLEGINDAFRRENAVIVRLAKEEDCILIPAADALSGEPSYYLENIMHFAPPGSQRMAEVVADSLEKEHTLP